MRHQFSITPDIGRRRQTRPYPSLLSLVHPLWSRILAVTFSTRRKYAARVRNITQTTWKLEASPSPNPLEQIQIIDFLQRCGIDHLFRNQISEALHRQYLEYYNSSTESHAEFHTLGLHQASLRFRLLREEGYNVSSTDTFEGYINKEGKFHEEHLGGDILGLLSLFEASHMSTQGENILEEAKTFSKQLLFASINSLDKTSAEIVRNTLKYPQHVTLARFKADDFVREFKNAQDWRKEIVDLAVMEFDRARATYKDEVIHISKWWEELGLTKELKLARDEPSEWHMWSLGILPHPDLSKERIELTKPTSLIYIIDDIFDIYGEPEDLCLFTESVNRWDLETAEKLPSYMKKCLKAVFDVTSHISHEIWVTHGRNPEDQLRKAWTDLFNAYLVESKWFASGYLPTTDEYMEIGTITCGVHLVLVHLMFLLGQGFDYENDSNGIHSSHIYTSIRSSVATILRLGNDLGRAKDEDRVEHDGSYIKCYMKENEGVSMKDAKEHLVGKIWNTWMCLNGLCLQLPHPYSHSSPYTSSTFKQGCLNLGRMVPLMYDYEKNPDQPILEEFRQSLLKI